MAKSWWHKEYLITGETQTPTAYLKKVYLELSDREIAANLTYYCDRDITRNAVRKRRYRLNLYKEEQQKNDSDFFEEDTADKNYNDVNVTQEQPLTLDEVVQLYRIDTDVWEVDNFKVNSWQVGAKAETKDLLYADGKVQQGTIKSDGLTVKTLYQTKASFVRKEPFAVLPVIFPMQSQVKYSKKPIHKKDCTQTALIFCDPHFGFTKDLRNAKLTAFHDRKVLSMILQVATEVQPDRIDLLGDVFDFAEWSDKFLRSPEFYWTSQPAIIEAHHYLSQLRLACPTSAITIHEGNHDRRLEMAIERYLPAAYGLRPTSRLDYPSQLSVESLLDLDALGIDYIDSYPDDYDMLGCQLELMHGNRALSPFRTVQEVAKSSDVSKIFGHIHRIEYASHTRWNGQYHKFVEAISPGCTCRIDGVVPGTSKRQQWQNGFMMVEYCSATYNYQIIPVRNNRCIYNGNMYTGNGSIVQLKAGYPDWNW